MIGYGLLFVVIWAAGRLIDQLGRSLVLLTRAIPLLLVFALVLFVNTETWQVFSSMPGEFLALVAAMFVVAGSVFLVARLPREVTALERAVAAGPALDRRQRLNVAIVMFVSQALQVLVVSLAVGAAFTLFGTLAIGAEVRESWIGSEGNVLLTINLFGSPAQITEELLRVSGGIARSPGSTTRSRCSPTPPTARSSSTSSPRRWATPSARARSTLPRADESRAPTARRVGPPPRDRGGRPGRGGPLLGSAFANNPATSWTFRDAVDPRGASSQRGFADYLRHIWLPRGECWTTDDARRRGAVAAARRAGRCRVGVQLRLMPTVLATARLEVVRLMRFLNLVERKHPHEPHWYLAVLGVDPDRQGRGFGSHLMQPVLERCDANGDAGLPGDRHRAQRAAVRAPRVRGHRGVQPARRRAADLADVAS